MLAHCAKARKKLLFQSLEKVTAALEEEPGADLVGWLELFKKSVEGLTYCVSVMPRLHREVLD